MVSATGARESVATSTGADSRSPACGIALPDLLIRAATLTLGNFDKVSAGVIAMASVSVIFAGNPEAFNRATASGIGGPSTARANTNSVSAGCTFAASFGSSLTVTLIAISFGAAVAADAGAGSAVASAALCVPLPARVSASASSCCTASATLEPGCSSGSRVFHCFAASAKLLRWKSLMPSSHSARWWVGSICSARCSFAREASSIWCDGLVSAVASTHATIASGSPGFSFSR